MTTGTLQKVEQFLKDEKELLKDLAIDVANADTTDDYAKSKSIYDTQKARVTAISDTLKMLTKG